MVIDSLFQKRSQNLPIYLPIMYHTSLPPQNETANSLPDSKPPLPPQNETAKFAQFKTPPPSQNETANSLPDSKLFQFQVKVTF